MKTVKYTFIALVALVFLGGTVQAEILYGISYQGANGPSTLHIINQNTGAATPLGPIGFERCSGMDFMGPSLYATCERSDGTDTQVLVSINPRTGAGTEVGPIGTCDNIFDMSIRGDGVLFADGWLGPLYF